MKSAVVAVVGSSTGESALEISIVREDTHHLGLVIEHPFQVTRDETI